MSVSHIAHLMQMCKIMIMTAYLVLSSLVLSCLDESHYVIHLILFTLLYLFRCVLLLAEWSSWPTLDWTELRSNIMNSALSLSFIELMLGTVSTLMRNQFPSCTLYLFIVHVHMFVLLHLLTPYSLYRTSDRTTPTSRYGI